MESYRRKAAPVTEVYLLFGISAEMWLYIVGQSVTSVYIVEDVKNVIVYELMDTAQVQNK